LSDALTSSAFSTVTFANNATLTLGNVTGNTITTADATVGAGKILTIDGSGLTGTNSLIFNGAAETNGSFVIKGGAAADTLIGSANADVFTGGAGADKFVIKGGLTATTIDSITDFVTGTDTIAFSNTTVLSGNVSQAGAAVADFATALAAANAVLNNSDGIGHVNIQQVGADSYAFFNDGALSGADQVVKLTGVALAGVGTSDFVAAAS
jgi:hypothetical protein